MNRVERVLLALQMAGPPCLKLRYAHFPSCCVEASQSGAEALRRLGLKANAIEAVLGVWFEGGVSWCGATVDEAYQSMLQLCGDPGQTREEFVAMAPTLEWPDDPRHMVIEVVEEERWILDLTVAQLPEAGAPALRLLCRSDWPVSVVGRGRDYVYLKPTRAPDPAAASYRNEGLTLDLLDAMTMVRRCGFDRDRFVAAFMRGVVS